MLNENYTLLIVDDNEDNRDVLSRRLGSAGFKTITANDGQHALTLLHDTVIHLVLLDIMMPEVDGMTLLSQIRADNTFDDMPVIIVSAIDIDIVIEDCLNKGACGYVTKPYDMNVINRKIRECLNIKPQLISN